MICSKYQEIFPVYEEEKHPFLSNDTHRYCFAYKRAACFYFFTLELELFMVNIVSTWGSKFYLTCLSKHFALPPKAISRLRKGDYHR